MVVIVRSTVAVKITQISGRGRRLRRPVLFCLNRSISGGASPSPTEYGGTYLSHHSGVTLQGSLREGAGAEGD